MAQKKCFETEILVSKNFGEKEFLIKKIKKINFGPKNHWSKQAFAKKKFVEKRFLKKIVCMQKISSKNGGQKIVGQNKWRNNNCLYTS